MKEAFKRKKETFQAWLAGGSVEGADSYCLARRSAARDVKEAKTWIKQVLANSQMASQWDTTGDADC